MSSASGYERLLLDKINDLRAQENSEDIAPLQLERSLNSAADVHTDWMLEHLRYARITPDGSDAFDRMEEAGFTFSDSEQRIYGDTIAATHVSVGDPDFEDDVLRLFDEIAADEGALSHMLHGEYDYIGIGLDHGVFDFESDGLLPGLVLTLNYASTEAAVNLDSESANRVGLDDGRTNDIPEVETDDNASDEALYWIEALGMVALLGIAAMVYFG